MTHNIDNCFESAIKKITIKKTINEHYNTKNWLDYKNRNCEHK